MSDMKEGWRREGSGEDAALLNVFVRIKTHFFQFRIPFFVRVFPGSVRTLSSARLRFNFFEALRCLFL